MWVQVWVETRGYHLKPLPGKNANGIGRQPGRHSQAWSILVPKHKRKLDPLYIPLRAPIGEAMKHKNISKEHELDAAYEAANQDSDRIETLRDWNALDDVSDLIAEDEDWGLLRNTK
jgi:hypothetical protein